MSDKTLVELTKSGKQHWSVRVKILSGKTVLISSTSQLGHETEYLTVCTFLSFHFCTVNMHDGDNNNNTRNGDRWEGNFTVLKSCHHVVKTALTKPIMNCKYSVWQSNLMLNNKDNTLLHGMNGSSYIHAGRHAIKQRSKPYKKTIKLPDQWN